VLTAAVLISCFDPLWTRRGLSLMVGVGLIAVLTAVTIGLRVWNLSRELNRRSTGKP
jgi:hypothetical protein